MPVSGHQQQDNEARSTESSHRATARTRRGASRRRRRDAGRRRRNRRTPREDGAAARRRDRPLPARHAVGRRARASPTCSRRTTPPRSTPGEHPELRYHIAGRLISRRGHGKTAFLDVRDLSGSIQVGRARRRARAGDLRPHPEPRHRRHRRRSRAACTSPSAASSRSRSSECTLLTKALRPPPDKHHGLGDTGTRYRYRELDLIANEETRELFVTRHKIVFAIREWLERTQLRRGRNAGPAVARRRRRVAAVHDPPQRARPRPVPAHLGRAVPQPLHRRRHGERL